MSRISPPRPRNSASVFIGLWIGLMVVAGLGTFALLFGLAGGFGGSNPAPVSAKPNPVVTKAVLLPTAPPPTAAPQVTSPASGCKYPPLPASGFGYGIQSHAFAGGNNFFDLIKDLGLQWVKVQVRWNDLEKTQGTVEWGQMDNIMRTACEKGLRVMISVVAAPDWTHANPLPASEGKEAPPDNYQTYADFVGKVIDHYPGQIGAVEVWNEANLDREWNTPGGINAPEFVKLLQTAHAVIKSKDANIIVIAGALAPTGINCNVGPFPANCQPTGRAIIVDDVTYMKQFVQAGGLQYADCVGTHSNGTNLPPDVDAMNPPGTAEGKAFKGPWENKHYSYSLKSQVEAYAAVIGNKPQCVTEFGYASALKGKYPPGFEFAADVNEQQQGDYLVRAFKWMRASGKVKMAFLFNLDYGLLGGDPSTDDNVVFGLVAKELDPFRTRPAFDAIKKMEKP